jgi:hypothetical protein
LINVFTRDKNKCLQQYMLVEFQTPSPVAVPGPCDTDFDGPGTAIAWDNSGRIDMFWFSGSVGSLNQPKPALMHRWTDGKNWYTENLGVVTTSPALTAVPSVASWGTGHLDVFWRDVNNQIRWLGFDAAQKGKPGFTSGGWFSKETIVVMRHILFPRTSHAISQPDFQIAATGA